LKKRFLLACLRAFVAFGGPKLIRRTAVGRPADEARRSDAAGRGAGISR
jgi:hypothetical protein